MGIGLGRVLLNMISPDIETIVMAGHGPPSCKEVDRWLERYPKAKVFAFEPQSDLFNACLVKYRDEPRVVMRPEALTHYDGEVMLNVSERDGWSSTRPITDQELCPVREKYDVRTTQLDSMGISHIDLLYLDVQGGEEDVLLGGVQLLKEHQIDVIAGESVFTKLYNTPHSFHDVYTLLAIKFGYQFVGWYVPCYNKWGRVQYCDYVFATPNVIETLEEEYATG